MRNLKMSRILTFLLVLFITVSAFAQEEVIASEAEIPESIRNNRYFLESQRLAKLANDTYEYGDYEASAGLAEEAIHNAMLSDEYVATQLLAEAKRLVDWADFYNIAERHPNNVQLGRDHYDNAFALHQEESWNESSDFSIKSIEVLGVLQAGTGTGTGSVARTPSTTSSSTSSSSSSTTSTSSSATGTSSSATTGSSNRGQYTVRTWAVERDCFWTIAGYDWVYGDPRQWRRLYEANKNKIPDPNNPDLVEPGTVLDIPR